MLSRSRRSLEMANKRISSSDVMGCSCGRETATAAICRDYSDQANDWLVGIAKGESLSHKLCR